MLWMKRSEFILNLLCVPLDLWNNYIAIGFFLMFVVLFIRFGTMLEIILLNYVIIMNESLSLMLLKITSSI